MHFNKKFTAIAVFLELQWISIFQNSYPFLDFLVNCWQNFIYLIETVINEKTMWIRGVAIK